LYQKNASATSPTATIHNTISFVRFFSSAMLRSKSHLNKLSRTNGKS
jgi:hypothetical protein